MPRLRIRDTRGLEGVAGSVTAHAALTTTAHGGIVADDDSRLSDARTPTTHAASHTTGDDKIQVSATDKLLGRSSAGAGDMQEITCTAAGRALLDDAAASNQRTTLGLGTGNSPQFTGLTLTGAASIAGTVSGTIFNRQKTYEMLGLVLAQCADCRLLLGWNEAVADAGTSKDYSLYLNNATYVDACDWAANQRVVQGFSYHLAPAAADYLLVADSDSLSFGDGATDVAFSVGAWFYVVNNAQIKPMIVKGSDYLYGANTEWAFYVDANKNLYFLLCDPSVPARQAVRNTAIAYTGWHFFCATYSGTGGSAGAKLYADGAEIAHTNWTTGAYTAMENLAQDVGILGENDGGNSSGVCKLGFVCVDASEWTAAKINALYTMTRGFYNL